MKTTKIESVKKRLEKLRKSKELEKNPSANIPKKKKKPTLKTGSFIKETQLRVITKEEFYEKAKAKVLVAIDDTFPEIQDAITINNKIWGTYEGISVIKGAAKSRKSFLVAIAISAAICDKSILGNINSSLRNQNLDILYFDTEQTKRDVLKAAKRIVKITNKEQYLRSNVRTFAIRGMSIKERLVFINQAIAKYDNNLGLVIIDGIRDLVYDINSPQEASQISDHLLKWTEEKNTHIITVLHSNKTNNNLRGHLGTELMNKAETVLNVEKSKKNPEVSIVTCEESRNLPFEPFAFRIEDDIPILAKIPNKDSKAKSNHKKYDNNTSEFHKRMITNVFFKTDQLKFNHLKKAIAKEWTENNKPIGLNIADDWIDTYCDVEKWIKKTIKGNSHIYDLNIDL